LAAKFVLLQKLTGVISLKVNIDLSKVTTLWGRVVFEIQIFLIGPRNASSITFHKITVFRGGHKITCFVVHAMKVYGGIEVWLQAFLISAQDEMSGQIHYPVALSRG
jgi:hypothetical protein